MLRPWLREPLVHFLAMGALLFLLFSLKGGSGSSRIVVTPGEVDSMAATFARTWQRPPTEQELKGLLDDRVRDEMAVREAVSLGLDRDDAVIRRRLRQKLEFIVEGDEDAVPVTDAELQAFLDRHADKYRIEPTFTFRQVYLNPDRRRGSLEADGLALLQSLSVVGEHADISRAGDALMLPSGLERATRSEVARQFGDAFAGALVEAPTGRWTGPVPSGFGVHVVFIRDRVDGRAARLDEVRQEVERDLLTERRKERLDRMYRELPFGGGRGGPGHRSHGGHGRAMRLHAIGTGLLALALAPSAAGAHEVRPGFLELRETAPGTYSFLWKKPAGGEVELYIAPVIPRECRLSAPGQQALTPGAVLVRGTLTCEDGIEGRPLAIDGLEATLTDVLVRVWHADGRLESHVLKPVSPAVTLGARTTTWQRAAGYLRLGVEHILLGADHLLFVLGLMLIVDDRRMLVKTITSFTLAHSITLAAATLGYATAPVPPLNAAIALSILFLGPEIVRRWRAQTSFTIRHPWVVAFAFGLLHGFGFASGLTTMGLPQAEIPLALLLFNVGVEAGQLFFVALILGLGRSFQALEIRWPRFAQAVPGYVVGSLGAYWAIQRTAILIGGLR
jgi:hydrogenase/urease accessory protein HupE